MLCEHGVVRRAENKEQWRRITRMPEQQPKRIWSIVCAHYHQACHRNSASGDRKWPTYDVFMPDVWLACNKRGWKRDLSFWCRHLLQNAIISLSQWPRTLYRTPKARYNSWLLYHLTVFCHSTSVSGIRQVTTRQGALVGCCWREGSQGQTIPNSSNKGILFFLPA
jgi:hypothetical protein